MLCINSHHLKTVNNASKAVRWEIFSSKTRKSLKEINKDHIIMQMQDLKRKINTNIKKFTVKYSTLNRKREQKINSGTILLMTKRDN